MKVLFISDAHYPLCGDGLIDLLLSRYREFDRIYILGDLFEFYFGYKGGFYTHHIKLINTLRVISARCELYMFEGNHEYRLERLKEFVNVEVFTTCMVGVLDGMNVFMAHGDTVDKTDVGYMVFRAIVKNRFSLNLLGVIPPLWMRGLSEYVSSLSRFKGDTGGCNRCSVSMMKLAGSLIGDGTDLVVLAHSHAMECVRMGNGIYINTGAYLNNGEFVVYDSDRGFEFYRGGKRIWSLLRKR